MTIDLDQLATEYNIPAERLAEALKESTKFAKVIGTKGTVWRAYTLPDGRGAVTYEFGFLGGGRGYVFSVHRNPFFAMQAVLSEFENEHYSADE